MNRRVVFTACISLMALTSGTKTPEASLIVPNVLNAPVLHDTDEWNCFIEALIWVESKGDSMAIGKGDCVGILQITPIYVKDANRIIGKEIYTLEDRFNRQKSIEIFNIIQRHYNPSKDIDVAIKLHNPRSGKRYANDIKDKLLTIKNINK